MPVQCPACYQQTPHHLNETSKDAVLDYYRCLRCGHIWTANKQDPSIVVNVTPLPPKPS